MQLEPRKNIEPYNIQSVNGLVWVENCIQLCCKDIATEYIQSHVSTLPNVLARALQRVILVGICRTRLYVHTQNYTLLILIFIVGIRLQY